MNVFEPQQVRYSWILFLSIFLIGMTFSIGVESSYGQNVKRTRKKASESVSRVQKPESLMPLVRSIQRPAAMRIRDNLSANLSLNSPSSNIDAGFNVTAAIMSAEVSRGSNVERVPLTAMPSLDEKDLVHVRVSDSSNLKASGNRWTLLVAFFNPGSPVSNNRANRDLYLPEKRLYENDQWYTEHTFVSPGNGMVPIIFLVPKENYRDKVFELLTKKRDQLQNIGNLNVALSSGRSKFEQFFSFLQEVRAAQPTASDGMDWESRIRRIAKKGGFELPADWKNVPGIANPSWEQIVSQLMAAHDPQKFELDVKQALVQGSAELLKAVGNYYGIGNYIELAFTAINIIYKYFKKDPLVLLATIYKPLTKVKGELTVNQTVNASGNVTGIPFAPFQIRPGTISNEIGIPRFNCLANGENMLTDVGTRLADNRIIHRSSDPVSREFTLRVTNAAGDRARTFSLEKNLGSNAWELTLGKEDLDYFSTETNLAGQIFGKRGFDDLRSNPFPINGVKTQEWDMDLSSRNKFVKDGKTKTLIIKPRSSDANCDCLTLVKYVAADGTTKIFEKGKPGFTAYSDRVELALDTSNIPAGKGRVEIFQRGETEGKTYDLTLYPELPGQLNISLRTGDRTGELTGTGLDQIQKLQIEGLDVNIGIRSNRSISFELPAAIPPSNSGQTFNVELEGNRRLSDIDPARRLTFPLLPSRLMLKPKPDVEFDFSARTLFVEPVGVFFVPTSVEKITVRTAHAMSDGYKFSFLDIDSVSVRPVGRSETWKLDKFEEREGERLDLTIPMDATLNGITLRNALAGGQLEFQIVDKVRGATDWMKLPMRFVNVPGLLSVSCPAVLTGNCTMRGTNLEYIKEFSTGGDWVPATVSAGEIAIGAVGFENRVWVKLWGMSDKLQLKNVVRDATTP